jgi:hypothetical protein
VNTTVSSISRHSAKYPLESERRAAALATAAGSEHFSERSTPPYCLLRALDPIIQVGHFPVTSHTNTTSLLYRGLPHIVMQMNKSALSCSIRSIFLHAITLRVPLMLVFITTLRQTWTGRSDEPFFAVLQHGEKGSTLHQGSSSIASQPLQRVSRNL